MKIKTLVVNGLATFVLAGVSCIPVLAEEGDKVAESSPFLFARANPDGATVSPQRIGRSGLPAIVPKSQSYPAKLALAVQPTADSASAVAASVATANSPAATANQSLPAGQAKGTKRISGFSLFENTGDHLAEMVSVFGERVVPPPEVSDLVHVEESYARDASDKYHWTFWKCRNTSDRPIFGTDFLFTYHYPTFGECPKGFRGGEVIVGFGLTIPLNNFKPLGHLFTSR